MTYRFLFVLKARIRNIYAFIRTFGFDPISLRYLLRGYSKFLLDYFAYRSSVNLLSGSTSPGSVSNLSFPYPIIHEFYSQAGSASGHYFHQDLLVANKIFKSKPLVHFDVGSKIDGFISHLLSFDQKLVVGDIRPLPYCHPSLSFLRFDLMQGVDVDCKNKYFDSISCLHAIEHMGLGRYGDPIDPFGHYKAVKNLTQLLSPDGILYLSHPFGQFSRVEFNAHRVISLSEIMNLFSDLSLEVVDFSYVDDHGSLHQSIHPSCIDTEFSYNMNYGCAIWTLRLLPN